MDSLTRARLDALQAAINDLIDVRYTLSTAELWLANDYVADVQHRLQIMRNQLERDLEREEATA